MDVETTQTQLKEASQDLPAPRPRNIYGNPDWVKGVSGNPAGKPKGTVSHITKMARDIARGELENPKYLAKLRERLEAGKVAPPVEVMLWSYAYGKPVEKIELTGPDGQPLGLPNLFEARARMLELLAQAAPGQPTVYALPAPTVSDAYQDAAPAPCESDRMLSNSAETQNAERAGTEPVPGTLDDRQGESETSAEKRNHAESLSNSAKIL